MEHDGDQKVVSTDRALRGEDIAFDDVLMECVGDPYVVWVGVIFELVDSRVLTPGCRAMCMLHMTAMLMSCWAL